VADAIDDLAERRAFGRQTDKAPSMEAAGADFPVDAIRAVAELEARSFPQALPGMHERLPRLALVIGLEAPDEQTLGTTAAGQAVSEEPRGEDPGVVDHEQIAGLKQ
jgi:hypothetical protein